MAAKITNQMKADCIGEFSVKIEKQCNRCVYLEDTPCQCRDSEDGLFTDSYEIPWDTCKQIYKRMASHEPILNDNFETALAALIEHHGADALTSLAAVMRHHDIDFWHPHGFFAVCGEGGKNIFEHESSTTEFSDIKPEK